MPDFQLFRVQVFVSPQRLLETNDDESLETPRQILDAMMRRYRRADDDGRWHMGDVEQIDDSGFYFRFGRERNISRAQYINHRFIDESLETVPYSHVLLDTDLGLVAVGKESEVARQTITTANQLRKYLQGSELAERLRVSISLRPLIDPTDLVDVVRRSVYVRRFRIEISRPNAWDVERDFVKPCQNAVEFLEGEKGNSDVSGDSLNRDRLVEVIRSAASLGTDAAVWARQPEELRAIKRKLSGNQVIVPFIRPNEETGLLRILSLVRAAYERVRRGEG
jgi:hypothetical protein